MVMRVVILLHNLQSYSTTVIFGEAFMEGQTMIPRAFFYTFLFPLNTTLPNFCFGTASAKKVAVG